MSVCAQRNDRDAPTSAPDTTNCDIPLPTGGEVLVNYIDNIVPQLTKEKLGADFEVTTKSRTKILDLLRPEDRGSDSLEAIVRPLPRRGLIRPYDADTRRFLQQVLLNPTRFPLSSTLDTKSQGDIEGLEISDVRNDNTLNSKKERSLADELREAEEDERSGSNLRRDLLREFRKRGGGVREAMERDRLGKLALSVEQDEECEDSDLTAAARRLDALLAESRNLHEELAGIHEDIQAEEARACRCAEVARALTAESLAVKYLDDVVALLRGDVASVARARDWPFALGHRHPDRNYIV